MPPKKSIYRQPNAQHFQLVHRSLRDPLSADPEASQRILKPVTRANDASTAAGAAAGKRGNTLTELAATADPSMRPNEGEAALYGITYDDSAYDYMSHLRTVVSSGDGILIQAPRGSGVAKGMKTDRKGKGRAVDILLPDEVLASREELSQKEAQARAEAIPAELQGFQPDMDPHLRQVLEALDDDAFVANGQVDGDDEDEDEDGDEDDDGWFDELVIGGERDEGDDDQKWEFDEWGVDDEGRSAMGLGKGKAKGKTAQLGPVGEEQDEDWMERFKAFKAGEAPPLGGSDDEDELDTEGRSEMADTVGTLSGRMDEMRVVGGKKRHGKRGPSDASGMSMSAASMDRPRGLRDIDVLFEKKIAKMYAVDGMDYDDEDDEFSDYQSQVSGLTGASASSRASGASALSRASMRSRALRAQNDEEDDWDPESDPAFMETIDKFLEQAGGGFLSVDQYRQAFVGGDEEERERNKRMILELQRRELEARANGLRPEKKERVKPEEEEGDKWDVQTILTTYTNTENHPAVIRSRTAAQAKARAEAQAQNSIAQHVSGHVGADAGSGSGSEESSGSDTETDVPKVTVARQKGETTEDRKARKAAVKADRSARRAEKKSHTKTFADERRRQIKTQGKMVANGRAADLPVGVVKGVVSLS